MTYVALPSHFRWQAQLDAWFSPTLEDEISAIPFTFTWKGLKKWEKIRDKTNWEKLQFHPLLLWDSNLNNMIMS